MLTEIEGSPDRTPGSRRWFRGEVLELVVWTDDDGVRQYQLRYHRGPLDGVYEWRRPGRLYHYHLDDGEDRAGGMNATPVLSPGRSDDLEWVRARFAEECDRLEPALRSLVERTLADPAAA